MRKNSFVSVFLLCVALPLLASPIQLFEKAEDKIGADEVRALLQNEK